jgi:hypothetical protein
MKNKNFIIATLLVFFASMYFIYRDAQSEVPQLMILGFCGTSIFAILLYLFDKKYIKPVYWDKGDYNYLIYGGGIGILLYGIELIRKNYEEGWLRDIMIILLVLILVFIGFSWAYVRWKKIQVIRNEKAKSQLSQLKNQINPHFFFNTLNNLYSLIKTDPDAAQDYVLKLSDLMSFTIYEGQKEFVSLGAEIEYLKNYIALQTARYHKEVKVDFEVNILDSNRRISPLMIVILLENAFKHGVESLLDNAYIKIHIEEKEEQIRIKVKNNFEYVEKKGRKGIGLKNLKDRLEILLPNRHQLITETHENEFEAILRLDI